MSSLSICVHFLCFPCLIALPWTFNVMVSSSRGKRGCSRLVPNLGRLIFYLTIEYDVSYRVLIYSLFKLREITFIPSIWVFFSWICVEFCHIHFLCIHWYQHMHTHFQCAYILKCIDWFVDIEPTLNFSALYILYITGFDLLIFS